MRINFTAPALGGDEYPDIHIALSELKKAKTDGEEYVSLVRLHEMIGALTGADVTFNETVLDSLIKGVGNKGDLVIAISCVDPRRYRKEYYVNYYVISDNIPKLLEVTFYE